MTRSRTIRPPRAAGPASVLLAVLAFLMGASALLPAAGAAKAPVDEREQGETPTTGGLRPGPVGLAPLPFQIRGSQPIAIKIEQAAVDAQVEVQEIVDGVMLDPSGPFVVSWYRETARLGQIDNVVMSGHLDYWDVGEAVFYNVGQLTEGDVIEVTGDDDETYRYEVEWVRNYQVDELDQAGVQEIVGNTTEEKLTLITCGGPFDYNRGEYLERMVVRASRVTEE